MDYRDPHDSIRIRRERISSDLAEARRAAERALELAQRVTVLEKDLIEANQLLEGGVRRRLSLLDDAKIASPCTAKWEEMVGDERVRFCGHCKKEVYDLSAMQRDEAEALLVEKSGGMCARLYRRADGTVMTADCPKGAQRRRRRLAITSAVGGGILAASSLQAMTPSRGAVKPPVSTMGEMTIVTPPPPQAIAPHTTGVMMGGLSPVHLPSAPSVPASPRAKTTR